MTTAAVTTNITLKDGATVRVDYNELANVWEGLVDDERVRAESLAKLREKLERKTSPKAKARKVPALLKEHYGAGIKVVFATSLVGDGRDYARVTHANGSREQVAVRMLYADTPANREHMAKIKELASQERVLADQREKVAQLLTRFDLKQLED
jgi:hypothetical protein